MEVFRAALLPNDWRQEPPAPSLPQLGDAWVRAAASAMLEVPSAMIPDELNYLLNPKHADFAKITIQNPTDLTFDPRLVG